ncbi:unnamed protein product [Coregonus sp. 'balchen']|nr:unnamed protein product [Coregonus sp. 'balchen']
MGEKRGGRVARSEGGAAFEQRQAVDSGSESAPSGDAKRRNVQYRELKLDLSHSPNKRKKNNPG